MEDYGIETIRRAELGELNREELSALEEDANVARLRVGTHAERISSGCRGAPRSVSMDQLAVDLWENVRAAMKGQQG